MAYADAKHALFAPVRPYLSWLVSPIQVLVNIPQKTIFWGAEHLASREYLVSENERLSQDVLALRGRLQKMNALQAENIRLRELLDASQRVEEELLMAEVIGFDQNAYTHKVLIDKGFSSGAYVGQAVLDANGVMGQIIEVGAYSSRVLLIADTSHFLPVQLARTGLRSIVQGTGDLTMLSLMSVPHSADIKKGDVLTTSGLDDRFPSDYPVGVVKTVNHVPGKHYADVEVVALAQLERSRHVMLIVVPESQRQ